MTIPTNHNVQSPEQQRDHNTTPDNQEHTTENGPTRAMRGDPLDVPQRQRRNAISSGTAFFPRVHSHRPSSNEVFITPHMSAEEIESHRRDLRVQRIRTNLKETKKQHYKIIKDAAEVKARLKRLDEEEELRIRHRLQSPFPPSVHHQLQSTHPPIRPASAIPVVHPDPAVEVDQLPAIDVLRPQRHSSAQDKKVMDRSPFFTEAKTKNHVTFSLPANTQQVLGAVKKNYPAFLTMATQLLSDPKVDKEKIAEAFLRALERRADLYEKQAKRIEGSAKNATDERRQKLLREIAIINRQYQQTVQRIKALCDELECDRVRSAEDRPSPHHAHRQLVAGNRINQLRILQRVFERQ